MDLGLPFPYRVCFGKACAIEKPFPAEFGNAALTRWPLREQRVVALPTPAGIETRSALYLLLSVKVGLLPVVVTHLSWEPELADARAAQLAAIQQFLATEMAALPGRVPPHIPILPPLLLGDLNAPPDSAAVLGLVAPPEGRLAFVDGFAQVGQGPGDTFSSRNPFCPRRDPAIDQRIDYTLVGRAGAVARLSLVSSQLCFAEGEGGVFPSDHFGVRTDLEISTDPVAVSPSESP